jgi:alcohol dehydrogenase
LNSISSFYLKTKVVHGVDSLKQLGNEINTLSTGKGLLICDHGIRTSELFNKIESELNNSNIKYTLFTEIEGEANTSHVYSALNTLIEEDCKFIIGFGGGSSIDVAKGVAILATNGGSLNEYEGMRKFHHPPIPLFAIPTTAGTGSEVTHACVFKDLEKKKKFTINHPELNRPNVAILDPTLLKTIPKSVATISSIDALTHGLESFVSKKSDLLTECLSKKAIELIARNIKTFIDNPTQIDSAYHVLLGSNIAGIAFSHSGTGNIHCLARYIGGRYDISHGVLCGITFPAVVEFNLESAVNKYAMVARIFEPKLISAPEETAALELPNIIRRLLADLEFPQNLELVGVKEDDLVDIAKDCAQSWYNDFNPRYTTEKDYLEMLKQSF